MLNLTFYNLSVKIETNDQRFIDLLSSFLDQYYVSKQLAFGKSSAVDQKPFYSKLKEYSVYYIHNNQFIHFYNYLEKIGYKISVDNKIDKRDYKIVEADYEIREGWELRDYQIPVVEFLLNNPTKSKLVPLPTGYGKTLVSLWTIGKLRQRLGIVLLPAFIDKFVQDIVKIHKAKPDDIMVIQGSKALRALIDLAKSDSLNIDYFIFSNRTLYEYITTYEEDPELCVEMYGIEPIELFPLLGIGVMLIDESHMHFNSVYKIIVHTNVKYQIGLTATLMSDDSVVKRMHKIIYPSNCIYTEIQDDRYVDIYAINYTISENCLKLIKTTNFGSSSYNHIAFEKSILKKNFLLDNYIKVIQEAIEIYYIDKYESGDKLLIFVATIKLATILTERLQELYGHKFKVARYCEEDPYDNLMNSDIIISTNISAGTGVDIPNLRVCIQTVSISSPVMNIQSLGRLRKIPGKDVRFCYIYSSNISKQVQYHRRRQELFSSRAANHVLVRSRAGLY